jgi:hypothetical protein
MVESRRYDLTMSDKIKRLLRPREGKPCPTAFSTLLTRNLHDVFGENDSVRRRAAIDEIFTEDCCSTSPRESTVAATGLIGSRARSRLRHPDFWYQPITEPEELGNGGRIRWVSGRSGEAPAYGLISSLPATAGYAAVYLLFRQLA